MTTNSELGRRLVACRHWRWMPGMLAVAHREQPLRDVVARITRHDNSLYRGSAPDMTDPATLGCVLHLVREAWGDDHIVSLGGWTHVRIYPRGRALEAWNNGDPCATIWDSYLGWGEDDLALTEAGALVAALEAAP